VLLLVGAVLVLVAGAWGSDRPHRTLPAPRAHTAPATRHFPKRPPQFVVVSFDGSGGARLLRYWRRFARGANARFTFFVSGVYLLDWRDHDRYRPPRNPRGTSAIGFAPDQAWVTAMRRELARAYRDGDEIGTHYNGHFCGPGGVASWTAADWRRELDEFDRLLVDGSPRLRSARARSSAAGRRASRATLLPCTRCSPAAASATTRARRRGSAPGR